MNVRRARGNTCRAFAFSATAVPRRIALGFENTTPRASALA
ncbi:MAG TPA: hypothetical protein VJL61_10150 [Rhodanobacteraceae bacterium]|nr:hypothetical protein [Rhodanobacteraceae bacterium]